ncbi:MAG: dihydroxy-acid dehydratase [Planctomycetaceae bacterium]
MICVLFGHRSRQKQSGFDTGEFAGKPVIGILNTWNDLISCHAHFRQRADDIKRGVWQAGGISCRSAGDGTVRNVHEADVDVLPQSFLAMEARKFAHVSHRLCRVTGGCDKTIPALLMGRLCADVPST